MVHKLPYTDFLGAPNAACFLTRALKVQVVFYFLEGFEVNFVWSQVKRCSKIFVRLETKCHFQKALELLEELICLPSL